MPHFSHSILVFAAAALIGSSAFAASPIPAFARRAFRVDARGR